VLNRAPIASGHRGARCDANKPAYRSFDCTVMELADDIADGIHDIEDIVARRLADLEEVRGALDKAFDTVGGALQTNSGVLDPRRVSAQLFGTSFDRKQMIGQLVSAFITAVRVKERKEFEHPLLRFAVGLPPEHEQLLPRLRTLSFKLVIEKASSPAA
jgi:dGTPase